MRGLLSRLRALFRRSTVDQEIREEIDGHLAAEADALIDSGVPREAAELAARRRVGNVTLHREDARDAYGWRWLDDLIGDVRYGWRQLRRAPGFAASAVLILGLGIGANAAVVTLGHRLFDGQNPGLPGDDRLVRLAHDGASPDRARQFYARAAERALVAYRDRSDLFESVAMTRDRDAAIDVRDAVTAVRIGTVSGGYFQVVKPPMTLGRPLVGDDGADAGAVVITYAFWRRAFSSDSAAVGSTIRIDGQPFTVVGVTGPRFSGTAPTWGIPDRHAWVSVAGAKRLPPERGRDGGERWIQPGDVTLVARLRPGVEREMVAKTLTPIASRIGQLDSEEPLAMSVAVESPDVTSRSEAKDHAMMVAFLGAVTLLVLLITCTNVGTLFLVRAAARRREIAVRLSLGATRRRLIRQLLAEAGALAAISAAAAVVLIIWLSRAFERVLGANGELDVRPDRTTYLGAAALAVAAAFLFGLVPALHATRASVADALKDAGTMSTRSRARLHSAFVIAQVALTQPFLVSVSSGITASIASLREPVNARLESHVVSAMIGRVGGTRTDATAGRSAAEATSTATRAALAGLPGVSAVVLSYGGETTSIGILDPSAKSGLRALSERINVKNVEVGWAELMEHRMSAGRPIDRTDVLENRSAIVLSAFIARQLFGEANPVGRQVQLGGARYGRAFDVVGVCATCGSDVPVIVREPNRVTDIRTFVMRLEADGQAAVPVIRQVIRTAEPQTQIYHVKTLSGLRHERAVDNRRTVMANAAAGALALTLASIGLYAIIAFGVGERRREIGVRMALGARGAQVTRLFFARGVRLTAIGVAIGLPLSVAAVRATQRMLSGASAVGPIVILAVVIAALAVAAVASWLPARRAASVDPLKVLRAE
jgi:predicted permease